MDRKPWDIHPSLTHQKLYTLALIIKRVRERALDLYDPSEGDGPWGLGCRVYERTINTLEKEAETLPWLSIIRNNLYFVFLIDGIPVRFYKGDIENPNFRSLKRRFPELEAQQEVFPYDTSQWFWRLVVETDEIGGVFRILMVQYEEGGNFQNSWEIPIGEKVPIPDEPLPAQSDSVVLDSPAISLKQKINTRAVEGE